MSTGEIPRPEAPTRRRRESEQFSAWCELEFERRANSDEAFDERAYRRAMALVVERLRALEAEEQS